MEFLVFTIPKTLLARYFRKLEALFLRVKRLRRWIENSVFRENNDVQSQMVALSTFDISLVRLLVRNHPYYASLKSRVSLEEQLVDWTSCPTSGLMNFRCGCYTSARLSCKILCMRSSTGVL